MKDLLKKKKKKSLKWANLSLVGGILLLPPASTQWGKWKDLEQRREQHEVPKENKLD